MAAVIAPEHPASPDATALIGELDAHLEPLYARESRHGFSVQKLIADSVAFFVIRDNGTPAGCGGIKLFGTHYGKLMLDHLADHAMKHGITVLRLETGIHQHAAIRRGRGLPPYSSVWGIPGRPSQPVLREASSGPGAS